MGVKPDFKVYVWENIIPALKADEIDIIAGGMAITPARALQVDFTRPYAESGVALAANRRMTRNIGSLEELDSPNIIVTTVADTLANDVVKRVFRNADVRIYSTHEEAEQQLLEGKAHAYVASMPEAVFLALANPDVVDLPLEDLLLGSSEALAVRRGEQGWLNFLNAWIEARKSDRWITVTHNYWFKSLEWADQVEEP
jgi:polar amino acid transport system substrate-binding protein